MCFVPDYTFAKKAMLSKVVKEMLEKKYGHKVRYPKDCQALAAHISNACKTRISGSTLMRLYGYIKGIQEPRLYTLDLISEYLEYESWDHLIKSIDPSRQQRSKEIEKLNAVSIKKGQCITLTYEPDNKIELKKTGSCFCILSSNDRKLLPEDEVAFKTIEVHYPLSLDSIVRQGQNLGKMQIARVSGITGIRKV